MAAPGCEAAWSEFIHGHILSTSLNITGAAVYDTQTLQTLYHSDGMEVMPSELSSVYKAFTDPEDIYRNWFKIGKTSSYCPIRVTHDTILGKNTCGGCLVCLSHSCLIIVTFHDFTQTAASCVQLMTKIVDFLRQHDI